YFDLIIGCCPNLSCRSILILLSIFAFLSFFSVRCIVKKIIASIKKMKGLFEKDPSITNLVTIYMSEIGSVIQNENLYVFSKKCMEKRSKGVKKSSNLYHRNITIYFIGSVIICLITIFIYYIKMRK